MIFFGEKKHEKKPVILTINLCSNSFTERMRKSWRYVFKRRKGQSVNLNPSFAKAYDFINANYPAGLTYYKAKIEQSKNSNNKFKWDEIYKSYNILVKMTDSIQTVPNPLIHPEDGSQFNPEIIDYTARRDNAKTNAVTAHYKEGVRLSKNPKWGVRKNCWNQFNTASNIAGSPYKNGKKIAANVYYKEGVKRSKATTWEKKKEAFDVFTRLTDIWGEEYNNHLSIAAEINYQHAKALASKKIEQVIATQSLCTRML